MASKMPFLRPVFRTGIPIMKKMCHIRCVEVSKYGVTYIGTLNCFVESTKKSCLQSLTFL